jgi:hypothetical protein
MTFIDQMRCEKERLNTFYDWPEGAWQTPKNLAEAGFFYTGSNDRTQCAFCRGILRNWEPNDVPIVEHGKHFEVCPFILGRNVQNIPIPQRQPITAASLPTPKEDVGLGIMTQRPKNNDYALEVNRLKSFEHPGWTSTRNEINCPSSLLLMKAGFFYTGFGDNVTCFFCNGGLRNWQIGDVPWKEHAKWYPRCPYVRMIKGDKYIQEVHSEINTPVVNAPGVIHKIDPREIKARMDTEVVKKIIGMGYPKSIIETVLEKRLREHGDDFTKSEHLMDAIFKWEEEAAGQPESTASIADPKPVAKPVTNQSAAPVTNQSAATPLKKDSELTKNQLKKQRRKNAKKVPEDARAPDTSAALTHLNREYQALIQENEEMKDQRVCKVCMDNNVNIVFLPCAHLVCCANCAPALRNCPICRKLIKGTVNIFIS